MKNCEVCEKEIPEDYNNLLCDEHYAALAKENQRLKEIEEETKVKIEETSDPVVLFQEPGVEKVVPQPVSQSPTTPDTSIKDLEYQENPEMEDKEQWEANVQLFIKNGVLLWKPTRLIYTFIKNWCIDQVLKHPQYPKFIWKPKIVDIGCGCGIGSNVLSQEADFVWGIDKNEKSIKFAKEAFERVKNGIYYSSQVTFDQIDVVKDNRQFMKFDVVVAVEVIEHINDWRGFVRALIRFDNGHKEVPTTYFISTPNRNHKTIQKTGPYNIYHVREWTGEELFDALSEFFQEVQLHNAAGEPTERTTEHTPLLAICRRLKV